jgi:hypothetical protein
MEVLQFLLVLQYKFLYRKHTLLCRSECCCGPGASPAQDSSKAVRAKGRGGGHGGGDSNDLILYRGYSWLQRYLCR